MLLHEGMTLHPVGIGITFLIFAVLSVFTMMSKIKQREKGLAGFMFLSIVILVASAVISFKVPPQ